MNAKRFLPAAAAALLLIAVVAPPAVGQCILANPSFELGGSGGAVFGGWNQYGVVGSVNDASHGAKAARVSGPNYGDWTSSGYWQNLDCDPGEQWEITGHVKHPSSKPLTDQSVAMVNVEWRDAAGDLISYESFTAADAASPADEYIDFSFVSGAAPAATASIHYLLGVLQGPGAPSPDVYFDQVTIFSTSSPTIDELQWNDFSGGRTVEFGGQTWRVKGPGFHGPGYNYFCDSADCVWVDGDGGLHLTSKDLGWTWASTEVTTAEALGYGDYVLTTEGRLDLLDPGVVLGLFLWEYGPCWDYGYVWWNAFNEIDIEYSRWNDPSSDLGQFVAQPFDYPGNISRFDASFGDDEVASHAMRWLPDRVEYRVWRGGPGDESEANLIHSWTYTGPHIPRPEQPRMHLNLWRIDNDPASNQEIVFRDFTFIPMGGLTGVGDDFAGGTPAAPAGRLYPAAPNPFNPRTAFRFELMREDLVRLDVYDVSGRLVRTLADGRFPAGEHRVTWAGDDDDGGALASGVYLIRLRGSDFVETRRVALIK